MIEIRYFQTRIFDTLGIALDGGRYFAPAPSRSFVRWNRRSLDFNLMYCYYTRDSLDWNLNEFFFDENYGDARIARRRFLETVVIFQDEEERKGFEILLRERHSEFEEEMSEAPRPVRRRATSRGLSPGGEGPSHPRAESDSHPQAHARRIQGRSRRVALAHFQGLVVWPASPLLLLGRSNSEIRPSS